MAVSVAGWEVLGQEPVPGEPSEVHAIAERFRADADAAQRTVDGLLDHAYAAGGGGWSGEAQRAYVGACGALAPEILLMVTAAQDAADVLTGFANAYEALKGQAEDVLVTGNQAAQEKATHEEAVETLSMRVSVLEVDYEVARDTHQAAREHADAQALVADPMAILLDAHAGDLMLVLNDALNDLQTAQADLAAEETAVTMAQERLDAARTQAEALAMRFEEEGTAAAAGLPVTPAYGLDLFRPVAPSSTTLPPPPPAPTVGVTAPSEPPRSGGGSAHPPPPVATQPPTVPPLGDVTGSSVTGSGSSATGAAGSGGGGEPPWVSPGRTDIAATVVAGGSLLASSRLDGTPAKVGQLQPSKDVFDEYRRYGLQAVAARGAAIARAFGFEGVIGGMGTRAWGRSDHAVGLALDLMVYEDGMTGDALAQLFFEHREELGLTYIIWDGRIASASRGWEWREYHHPAGRTDPTAMHLDHVHLSFDPDANPFADMARDH